VVVVEGKEDIMIKISDLGGEIPRGRFGVYIHDDGETGDLSGFCVE